MVDAVSKNKGGADLGAERVIVSALIQQGAKALAEIEPTIQKSDLSSLRNQALYECAKSIIEDQTIADSITPDLILTTAKEKGLEQVVSEDINYLQICCTANVNMNDCEICGKEFDYAAEYPRGHRIGDGSRAKCDKCKMQPSGDSRNPGVTTGGKRGRRGQ